MTSYLGVHGCIDIDVNSTKKPRSISLQFVAKQIELPMAPKANDNSVVPCPALDATTMPPMQLPKRRSAPCKAATQKRWLPTKLLQTQHFYEGKNFIWVPKNKVTVVKTSRQQTKPVQKQIVCKRWIPKPLLRAQNFYKGNICIWLPKSTQHPQLPRQDSTPGSATQINPQQYGALRASNSKALPSPTHL